MRSTLQHSQSSFRAQNGIPRTVRYLTLDSASNLSMMSDVKPGEQPRASAFVSFRIKHRDDVGPLGGEIPAPSREGKQSFPGFCLSVKTSI
jgi:hypothetical protein